MGLHICKNIKLHLPQNLQIPLRAPCHNTLQSKKPKGIASQSTCWITISEDVNDWIVSYIRIGRDVLNVVVFNLIRGDHALAESEIFCKDSEGR